MAIIFNLDNSKKIEESADDILKEAIGVYSSAIIIGYNKEDFLEARATPNLTQAQVLWLVEHFKHLLITMESDE